MLLMFGGFVFFAGWDRRDRTMLIYINNAQLDKRSAVLKENSQKVMRASLNRAFSPGLLDAGKAFDGKEMGKSSGKAITLDPLVHDDVDGDG